MLGWGLLAVCAGVLSYGAITVPMRLDGPAAPAALVRPPSQSELALLTAQLSTLQRELRQASQALGHPPRLDQLEATLPDGRPVLHSGLPDNPLMPGVAGVQARCPPTPLPQDRADWLYCPDDGRVAPAGLPEGYQLNGNE